MQEGEIVRDGELKIHVGTRVYSLKSMLHILLIFKNKVSFS